MPAGFPYMPLDVDARVDTRACAGADPGCTEKWFGQTSSNIISFLLLFNKSFFHKKKYSKNICLSQFRGFD